MINKKQKTKNQKQLKLYIFIALLCSVFILPGFDTVQHLCHTTNKQHVSIFINVLCFPFNHVCVVPCPCPENKDFSTNCSNFFQSKMLFGFCNGHSREQRLRRSRREVELHCCPLPHLHGFYISATEAKKREAGHPVISKVGLWRQ